MNSSIRFSNKYIELIMCYYYYMDINNKYTNIFNMRNVC